MITTPFSFVALVNLVIINGTPEEPLVIGEDTVVGAAACVTKSVPPGQVVVGVPARPLEKGTGS